MHVVMHLRMHILFTTSILIEQCKPSNVTHPSKKRWLSLSLKGRRADKATSSSCRFATSTEDVENVAKGIIPASTRCGNDWALRTFEEWIHACNINNRSIKLCSIALYYGVLLNNDFLLLCSHSCK